MLNQKLGLYFIGLVLLGLLFSCSAEPSSAPAGAAESEMMVEAEAPAPAEAIVEVQDSAASQNAIQADAVAGEIALDGTGPTSNIPLARPQASNRLIIKNAEINMNVADTDVTIDRSMGIVTEYGGYVVDTRTWFEGKNKFATLSIGVPVDNFEAMLRRLKDLAIKVTNETVSGQDVSDQFVDLEARLRNLEATADRIRSFLAQATTVEESLRVSQQLSEIEVQVEQVKGQMNYIKDRAAFSTITLQLVPKTPQPKPKPTATPVPWSAGQTFSQATEVTVNTAKTLFQVVVDVTIWLVIVVLPFSLPILLFALVVIKIAKGRR